MACLDERSDAPLVLLVERGIDLVHDVQGAPPVHGDRQDESETEHGTLASCGIGEI